MPSGREEWYRHGHLHREDGPAVLHANGSTKWYRDGKRHRDGAPACVYVNGTEKWYRNGLRHRDTNEGPAAQLPGWPPDLVRRRSQGSRRAHRLIRYTPVRHKSRARLVVVDSASNSAAVIFVEVVETPQRDWWVVADGRVVGLYLKTAECPDPLELAIQHGEDLSKPYGMSILSIGTTWRSRAFDHLEEMSCRRGVCCRMREMTEAEQDAFVEAEQRSPA